MFRSLRIPVLVLLCGWLQTPVRALDPEMASVDVPCSACHKCAQPTPQDLCLRACARTVGARKAIEMQPPDLVILDELEDLYLPVPFDHKGHANMAQMTTGCTVCHHFTPKGTEHPACKSCHEVSPVRENMRKPGLKAAYHRQCLACHREWSHETNCVVCHQPKAGRAGVTAAVLPSKGDIMGRMHPPIPEPDTEVYRVHTADAESRVIFRHKEHIYRFGLRCVECHQEDNCDRCHEVGRRHEQRVVTLEQHHQPCKRCHVADVREPGGQCDRCHWKSGESAPAPFQHARTGWALGDHHSKLSCRLCHVAVPFTKLNRTCNACHGDWNSDNFDHAVTGQVLDSMHIESDCDACHTDRRFEVSPVCDGCHDEEENIAFPLRRPGPRTVPGLPVGGSRREGDAPADATP